MIQDKLFFSPRKKSVINCPINEIGYSIEEVKVRENSSFKIVKPENPIGKRILHCHGNAGNITSHIINIYPLVQEGCEVIIWDYPGYGDVPGKPGFTNIIRHIDSFLKEFKSVDLIYGQSLGGIFATYMASKINCKLALEGTWLSNIELVKDKSKFPIHKLISDEISVKSFIKEVKDVRIMHSIADEVIPFRHGRMISDYTSKALIELGGFHLKSLLYKKYLDMVINEVVS